MEFKEFLANNLVYLDGGMGTLLQEKGLRPGEHPEEWNITHPEIITEIHKSYFEAGSNVVCTNTFGANTLKFSPNELERVISAAVENAKAARSACASSAPKYIALDIGPTGKLLKPLGDLDFEDAVEIFAKTVRIGIKYGVDLIMIETMNDSYETKAAVLAAKENSALPVLVSNAYNEDGMLMTGATPEAMAAMLEGLNVDALGANCSLGPKQLSSVIKRLLKASSLPIILKPNAGLPHTINGKTVFDVTPDEFTSEISKLIQSGVRIIGGCCGTTPRYISALHSATSTLKPLPLTEKEVTVVSSYTHAVELGKKPILIGERINPTGKKRFKQALIENDIDFILNEGVNQQEKGVHLLDVNVGLPDIDEPQMLKNVVCELQTVTDLPLQIDTSDAVAMEDALRRYNGKAMINSLNGKEESMNAVFPLVKKYGGVVVALTLDENGIPDSAAGRVEIAKRILDTALKYGIKKRDIVFDTLAMTISADSNAAITAISALKMIKEQLGCHTTLGVSNVSYGLPCRDSINSIFFALALENGLSCAIMNPYSADMMKTYYAYCALKGLDERCGEYISASAAFMPATAEKQVEDVSSSALQQAVIKGFKDKAGEITAELLKTVPPLEIVNSEIIPALNTVGTGYENKTVYLPQLLMSAEAAKCAFEAIKQAMAGKEKASGKGKIVLATVFGDIHDIGKNIVKLLLENYGFDVTDLGKDVKPEIVVDTVLKLNAPIAALSALMTTTVPAMEETIRLINEKAPWCKVVVGGAVLTEEYAKKIGADKYAADAMETVRYAEEILC